jgi:hypothetical protein
MPLTLLSRVITVRLFVCSKQRIRALHQENRVSGVEWSESIPVEDANGRLLEQIHLAEGVHRVDVGRLQPRVAVAQGRVALGLVLLALANLLGLLPRNLLAPYYYY